MKRHFVLAGWMRITGWYSWQPSSAATPQAAVGSRGTVVRLVKMDGTTLELRGAKVVGDSIKGRDAFGNADIAVASSDVRVVATRRFDGPRTALAVTGGLLAVIGGWFLLLLTSSGPTF